MTTRRSVLQGSALAFTAGGLASLPAWARSPGPAPASGLAISETFVFPEWLGAIREVASVTPDRGDQAFWAAWLRSRRPAAPSQAEPNSDPTLICLPAPGVEMLTPDRARAMARLANDRLAEAVAASDGRHAGLATLSAFDPGAVDEARRAVFGLGLAGLSLGANRGLRLDHPSLRPVFAFAADVGVPVYLPAGYAPATGEAPYRAVGSEGIIAGAAQDSARHCHQLIFGRILDAFPKLDIVLARLGEATPYWYGQLQSTYAALAKSGRSLPDRSVADYFATNIRLTAADMTSPTTLAFGAAALRPRLG